MHYVVLRDAIMDDEVFDEVRVGRACRTHFPIEHTHRNGYRRSAWEPWVGTMVLHHLPAAVCRRGALPSLLEPRWSKLSDRFPQASSILADSRSRRAGVCRPSFPVDSSGEGAGL